MTRRKGELSRSGMDHGWPHQVMVPEIGGYLWLTRWPSVCPRHHTVVVEGVSHHVYCFADPADAESFLKALNPFGAERFVPKRQGPPGWPQIKPEGAP